MTNLIAKLSWSMSSIFSYLQIQQFLMKLWSSQKQRTTLLTGCEKHQTLPTNMLTSFW